MTVLQRLLEADLVEVHDDGEMEKLSAAASLVEKQLVESKLSLAPATLIAMDPHVDPDEPILDAVYAAVLDQWPTVKRRHPDRPVAILRGVLTQALASATQADAVAAVVWATATSYAPFAPLAREQELWATILASVADKAENAAAAAWSGLDSGGGIEVRAPELPAISASAKQINAEQLKRYLAAAAGPVGSLPQGVTANTNAVQQNYSSTANPVWAEGFATTAAAGIAIAVDTALQASIKSIDPTPMARALEEYSTRWASAVATALAPVTLRSQVLLWRASLYSSSQRRAYRELAPDLAVIAIAADLANQVPPISPAGIDHLAWEAAHAVLGDKTTTIGAFAHALSQVNMSPLPGEVAGPGRKTLLQFVRGVAKSGEVPADARGQTGMEADTEIKLADLARWLFRDARAERIVTSPTRPRGRRK